MDLLLFILILGITIFIHELGHFIFAKRAGIYIYEFSLGMGPRIFKFNRKNDETDYTIRLFPIGGFVQMAGEEVEIDEKIPKESRLQSKTWLQKFLTIIAGVVFNFVLGFVLLFVFALIAGSVTNKTYIGEIKEGYPAHETNLKPGDLITKFNGDEIKNQDLFLLDFTVANGETISLEVKHKDGSYETVTITPKKETVDGKDKFVYGFGLVGDKKTGFLSTIEYSFRKGFGLIVQMAYTIVYLITGKLSLNNLSGPIGIYNVVSQTAATGFVNLIYLTALISINVGFINLLPIPAFDGGRLLFLIIEKIKGKPLAPKIENTIHSVFLFLLMLLMVAITYNDIIKIFIKR
ncbi:MAG: RIP metalloprotease RseP [Bacilli bacterium]|nr:RIP metalloprotease RseP [Bacilli bacterium]